MNSRQKAKQWPFARHKEFSSALRKSAANWFKDKGFITHPKMPYCLSDEGLVGSEQKWKRNIILKEVAEYIEMQSNVAKKKKISFPLHKYLHHGMSSQGMAFNLIGPLILRGDYSPLAALLKSKNVYGADDITEAIFEYQDPVNRFNEDAGQPTSIDIVLNNSQGDSIIFIESKFEEREFGGCSVFKDGDCDGRNPIGNLDSCYLHFIGRQYWNMMEQNEITSSLRKDHLCIFMAHYQFFREFLLAIEKGGTFVLLSDERSPVFKCKSDNGTEKGLLPFLTELLPDNLRSKVASITIQELVAEIEKQNIHGDWIFDFKRKYGMT
ncbi:hypothetical protein OR1_02758 [Geobacter sp. OR-1]|uniref:PGN_0703 family putative restriction endonuclease n=1 Tax=Geobacter sp. OR-1 TaxID=1266765 RepID=UPI0005441478|nr:hypothetical protein [Geobacter sp. OR-1]GAM10469.1 hypothetical protein OR1_02758 [Geobacter sp. OR-1]